MRIRASHVVSGVGLIVLSLLAPGAAVASDGTPTSATATTSATASSAAATRYWTSDPSRKPSDVSAQAQTWGACGWKTKNSKVVRAFKRRGAVTTRGKFPGGTSNLRCGNEKYGYRHIVARGHDKEWDAKARLGKMNWRDLADDSIKAALNDPDLIKVRRKNDTYGFERLMYLVDKKTGKKIAEVKTCTVVAHESKNIITAFPGKCPKGDA